MKIFDNVDRTYEGPASEQESHFVFLNRSARKEINQVRELMEDWFSRYPDTQQEELRVRLRSEIDRHFLSAFFELYLHELLIRLGYHVEVHPEVSIESGKRPDFLVSSPSGKEFYLEGILATDLSHADIGANNRIKEVYDALNDIVSPNFFIGINIRGTPTTPVPKWKLKRDVHRFLEKLDPDIVTSYYKNNNDFPKKSFSHDDWILEYYAIPKSNESRGKDSVRPLGVRMHMPKWVDTRTPIRDAIQKKSTKYGNLGKPYIIAVNSLALHLDNIDIMDALFGKESFVFTIDSDGSLVGSEPKAIRNPDGAWFGPEGPQNTRVSAVFIVWSLLPWSVAVRTPIIYHNPWSQFPCQEEMAKLKRAIPNCGHMETIEGLNAKDIFNLKADWPS
jgi:hypothetical protein